HFTPPPTVIAPSTYNAPTLIHRPRGRGTILALALVLALVVAAVGGVALFASGGNLLALFARNSVSTPTASTTSPPDATSTATFTATPSLFQLDQAYTYNALIGVSKMTCCTNADVDVVLKTLSFSTSNGASVLVAGFQDRDAVKGTNLAVHSLTHVYMIDNHGIRYQGIAAIPSQLILAPGQASNVIVTFPLIQVGVASLALYFNTDLSSLDVPCVLVSPARVSASGCPTQ